MQRRLIAAVVAVVLAGIGAVMLFNYVATADARAMAGLNPTTVLVVTQTIPANTPASQIAGMVAAKEIPASAVVDGALTSLNQVANLSTTTELEPGEQLLRSRFAEPGTTSSGGVRLDNNMQQLTLKMDAPNAAGGQLAAGDKVAVYLTVNSKIQQLLPSVLVTNAGTDGTVTLALAPVNVQKVLLGSQSGTVWLTTAAKTETQIAPITVKQIIG